jgi:hypothetical protein
MQLFILPMFTERKSGVRHFYPCFEQNSRKKTHVWIVMSCPSSCFKRRTAGRILTKLCMHVMPFEATPYFPTARSGAHGSVLGWGTMLQAGRSRVRFSKRSLDFPIDLILPAALWPWVDSASNRNEHQESSWGLKGCRRVRLTTPLPSVSRLSRENVGASTSRNPMALTAC